MHNKIAVKKYGQEFLNDRDKMKKMQQTRKNALDNVPEMFVSCKQSSN